MLKKITTLRLYTAISEQKESILHIDLWTEYLIHYLPPFHRPRITLFFANNYLTEYRITMEFLHNF